MMTSLLVFLKTIIQNVLSVSVGFAVKVHLISISVYERILMFSCYYLSLINVLWRYRTLKQPQNNKYCYSNTN